MCPRSARLGGSTQIESFDLSGQRTHILRVICAVCEYVFYTNQRDQLERIRSGSAWNMRCWADTRVVHMYYVHSVNAA